MEIELAVAMRRYQKFFGALAIILWAALAIGVAVKVGITTTRSVYPVDFLHSGVAWLERTPVYDTPGFQYFPLFAAVMALFALLPFTVGSLLWSALNFAVFLYGAKKFAAQFIPASQRSYFFLALLPPASEGLLNQQSNPLFGGLILLAATWLTRRQYRQAAAALVFPALIKIAPWCFAGLLGATAPKKMGWRMLIAVAVFSGGLFLLAPVDYVTTTYHEWFAKIVNLTNERHSYRDAFTIYNYVTTGAVGDGAKIGVPRWYQAAQLTAGLFAFISVILFAKKYRWGKRRQILFAYAAAGWWLLFFGPSTEIATIAIAAAAPAWALIAATRRRGEWLMRAAFILMMLGSLGDVEWHLLRLLNDDAGKLLFPVGSALFGIWLFGFYPHRENANKPNENVFAS